MSRPSYPDLLIAKAELAFELAYWQVIERSRLSSTQIVIWCDGEMVELSPDEATRELEANLAKREPLP